MEHRRRRSAGQPDRAGARLAEIDAPDPRRRRRRRRRSTKRSTRSPTRKARRCCGWSSSYVGADTFRKGVNAYLEAHAYSNATSEDFWKALSAAPGKPIERILPTFVNQPGVPLLDIVAGLRERPDHGDAEAAAVLPIDAYAAGAGPLAGAGLHESARTAGGVVRGADRAVEHGERSPAACAPWVFANAGASGYYRTAYASDMLRAMAPRIGTDLTAPERLSLIDDEWALVRAGRHSVSDYLTLAAGFGREHTSGVLDEVAQPARLRPRLPDDATRRARRFETVRAHAAAAALRRARLRRRRQDRDDRRSLRARRHRRARRDRRTIPMSWRSRAPRSTARWPAARRSIRRSPARRSGRRPIHGDARAVRRAARPPPNARRIPTSTTATCTRSATSATRRSSSAGWQLSLTPQLRSQDTALYLARFFAQPRRARPRAGRSSNEHWAELEPKITIFGRRHRRWFASMGSFCDAPSRDDITAFFAAAQAAGRGTHARSDARADQQLHRAAREADARVAAWLAAR